MSNSKRETRELTLQMDQQNKDVKPKDLQTSEVSKKSLKGISELVSDLQSTDRNVVLNAVTEIRESLSGNHCQDNHQLLILKS